MEWYHVCWPRLTAKRVEPVVSISWASCFSVHLFCRDLRYRSFHTNNQLPIFTLCSILVLGYSATWFQYKYQLIWEHSLNLTFSCIFMLQSSHAWIHNDSSGVCCVGQTELGSFPTIDQLCPFYWAKQLDMYPAELNATLLWSSAGDASVLTKGRRWRRWWYYTNVRSKAGG